MGDPARRDAACVAEGQFLQVGKRRNMFQTEVGDAAAAPNREPPQRGQLGKISKLVVGSAPLPTPG